MKITTKPADLDFNQSYIGSRSDVLQLVPATVKNVLDVGCSIGVLGAAIKEKTSSRVVGIDLSQKMADIASTKIDKVIVGNIEDEKIQGSLKKERFDAIIFADVLEHLFDPWVVLRRLTANLNPQGVVISSIPNIKHLDTIINLLVKGYWPYRKRGIHDWTHLRHFTKKNIVELFDGANLKIEKVEANYRLIESPHYLNKYAKYFALPFLKDFLAFQYLIVARKK